MIAAIWSRLSKWAALMGAVLAAIAAALLYGQRRGAKQQAATDDAAHAKAQTEMARTAADTYRRAAQASNVVVSHAQEQPPPDVAKRDDFDNTF